MVPAHRLRVREPRLIAVVLALLISGGFLLVLLVYHYFTEGNGTAYGENSPKWECEKLTERGLCVPEVFAAMDAAYRPLWPGQVDLLIRSYFSPRFFLLGSLWSSLDLFWPKGIGRVILVLDEGDEAAQALVPSWVEVKYEKNYLTLPGKILQQWSYGWADNYSSAPFIAIMDDDVVLNLKVTPFLLFNLTKGVPFIIGSKEQGYYKATTQFFLGRKAYFANFMVSLPFIQPRSALPLYRQKVAEVHPNATGGYDGVMKWWAEHGGETREQIAHTVMGNFIAKFDAEKADFALEWTDHIPVPRVGVHIPYTQKFADLGGAPRVGMLNGTGFLATAAYYTREALCFSFPAGQIPNCEGMPKEQSHIWRYAWDRERWRAIKKKRPDANRLYKDHLAQMHCMYNELLKVTLLEKQRSQKRVEYLKGIQHIGRWLQKRCIHSPLL